MLARNYDSEIGKFLSVDPNSANYPSWSPYHYSANNPLIITDPTGKNWYLSLEKGRVVWIDGSFNRFDDGFVDLGELSGLNDTSIDEITSALSSRGYSYSQSGVNGLVVNTKKQYNAWKMMQVGKAMQIVLGYALLSSETSSPRLFNFNSQYSTTAIAGLTTSELQRLNVANALKLGKITAKDASNSISKGGAAIKGIIKM